MGRLKPRRVRARLAIVALALVTKERSPDRYEIRIIAVEPSEDPEQLAEICIQRHGAHVVGALTRRIEPSELAPYVPGVAGCPDVAWIAVSRGEN